MDKKTWTPKFISVIVGLIALGVVAYAGVWYWYYPTLIKKVNTTYTLPIAIKNFIAPSNWKTYTNIQYKFQMSYPINDGLVSDKSKAGVGYFSTCNSETDLACFSYEKAMFPNTNFQGAGLSVRIVEDGYGNEIKDAKTCNYLHSDSPSIVRINNIDFYTSSAGDVGSGSIMEDDYYSVFTNSKCFDIIVRIDHTDISRYEGEDRLKIKEFDSAMKKQVADKLHNILYTIKFSPTFFLDLNNTPNLKTYTNTEYGFEFKYTQDWTFNDKDLPTSSEGNLFSLAKDGLTQTSKSLSFDDGAIISLGVTNTDGKVLDFSNKEITIDQWVENVSVGLGGDRVDNLPLAENGFVGKIRVVYNKEDFLKPWGEVGGAYKILPSGRVLLVSWQRMNLYTNDLSYTKYLLPILSSFKVIK